MLNREKYRINERLPIDPVAFPASYTPAEITAARLAVNNPDIKELISRLNLVDENKMPVAITITPDELQARDIAKLQRIAAKAFQVGQTYSEAEIIELISSAANVTGERALNGFNQMLCYKIILCFSD